MGNLRLRSGRGHSPARVTNAARAGTGARVGSARRPQDQCAAQSQGMLSAFVGAATSSSGRTAESSSRFAPIGARPRGSSYSQVAETSPTVPPPHPQRGPGHRGGCRGPYPRHTRLTGMTRTGVSLHKAVHSLSAWSLPKRWCLLPACTERAAIAREGCFSLTASTSPRRSVAAPHRVR